MDERRMSQWSIDKVMGKRDKTLLRPLLMGCGILCVGLGFAGMVLPVLPTTPFLLLAAVCFARSSERFYRWLMTHRYLGVYIRSYREGRGIPLKQKVLTLVILWGTIGATLGFGVKSGYLQVALMGIAIGVTMHVLRLKTLKTDTHEFGQADQQAMFEESL